MGTGTALDLHVERLHELSAIELKVTTGYTLADAIREGASVSRQAHGAFVTADTSCTLTAAYVAARARGFIR